MLKSTSVDEIFQLIYISRMAFDGSVVRALSLQLNKELSGGGISKIAQTDKSELLLTIKKDRITKYLLISVNPSLPVMYLTNEKKEAPLSAPSFCMFLRKHLQGGRITGISQPSLERIIDINIEHYDELGDLKTKTLTIELMGRHSNIILRSGSLILESIKHISSLISSVREVLPGREYFIPFSKDKLNPLDTDKSAFYKSVFGGCQSVYKTLYLTFTGFSPDLSQEICQRAFVDSDLPSLSVTEDQKQSLYNSFYEIIQILKSESFNPGIFYKNNEPVSFGIFKYEIYKDLDFVPYESISLLLEDFYRQKRTFTLMRQKSSDLRQIVQNLLNKDNKKYDLQLRQIKDTQKKDTFKVYGELLTAYGYSIDPKATSFTCENFYTGQEIKIPLDPTISAIDNGKKYFEKYSKLKRTYEALSEISLQTKEEIDHLESIKISLETAQNEADLEEIRKELQQCGYIKGDPQSKKGPKKVQKGQPLHFISTDGFDIYVGKNNYQNEYISFKLADSSDWWFHAKKIPGSHVIVKSNGKKITDKTFEEAACLAAFYSSGKSSKKVDVDYTLRKNLKKPAGAKPGFVIYHTNYSMTVSPKETI